MRDPHDRRELRLWAQCDDAGNVVSTHEIDAAIDTPDLRHPIELTSVGRDFAAVAVKAVLSVHSEAVKLKVKAAAEAAVVTP